MIKFASAQVWVNDQEEALAFYTDKLGFEVRADATLPEMGFRWLTVGPPAQPDISISLMPVQAPGLDDEGVALLRGAVARGLAGTIFLTTDDCRADYEVLKARGVEFSEPPEERPYGIDAGIRDPSGNPIRLTQLREAAVA